MPRRSHLLVNSLTYLYIGAFSCARLLTYCRGGSSTKVSLPIPSWATAEEKQQLNQLNRSLSQVVGQAGWLTIVNGNATFVRADSEGSKDLLQSICQYDGK